MAKADDRLEEHLSQEEDHEEVVLSSVHLGVAASANFGQNTVLSEFSFTPPPSWGCSTSAQESGYADQDGDLDVPRRHASCVLTIEHTMATPISGVGTQLWSGALLLADYLIHHHTRLAEQVVLELGSGVGLVGVVASGHVKKIFCTDIGETILSICQRNVHRNCSLMHGNQSNAIVRELDWRHPTLNHTDREFSWTLEDQSMLRHTSLVLAADVIYDDELTDAFFNCLVHLTSSVFITPPTVLVAMEKRINFSLEHMDVVSPAYSYFLDCIRQPYPIHTTRGAGEGRIMITAKQMSTDFKQYFRYDRVKELELWKLQLTMQ